MIRWFCLLKNPGPGDRRTFLFFGNYQHFEVVGCQGVVPAEAAEAASMNRAFLESKRCQIPGYLRRSIVALIGLKCCSFSVIIGKSDRGMVAEGHWIEGARIYLDSAWSLVQEILEIVVQRIESIQCRKYQLAG